MGDNPTLVIMWIATAVVIVLFTILLVNIKKRARAERAAIAVGQKLRESYRELELAYQEVTATKNALNAKYEQLKESKERVKRMAYSDYLTGLPNRVAFVEMLENVLLTLRHGEEVALLDIDIDNFKDINDTLGHSYGDEMLLDVLHRLEGALQENDYLSRIGGDEFAILLQNVSSKEAILERVEEIKKLFVNPFQIATKELFITVSIGIAIAPNHGKTTQSLIKNMNSAMYFAKGNGKNSHCFFDDTINQRLVDKLEMQSEMRKALDDNQFQVYYQAQVSLVTGRVIGFEALARWLHPQRGLIQPINFIPIAEENGMIVEIGKRMLKEACRQLKIWEDQGYDYIIMAVNFSARQFKDAGFRDMIYQIVTESQVNPKHLEFEITESIAIDDLEHTIDTIKELKQLGISFALDDFGTGYSSLNYLKRLPVSNLKIDKSFLDTILENDSDKKIVHTMIDLAKNLEIQVIAEGVEVSEQEHFLKDINCDKAQGYYYSKPVPSDEAYEFMQRMNEC